MAESRVGEEDDEDNGEHAAAVFARELHSPGSWSEPNTCGMEEPVQGQMRVADDNIIPDYPATGEQEVIDDVEGQVLQLDNLINPRVDDNAGHEVEEEVEEVVVDGIVENMFGPLDEFLVNPVDGNAGPEIGGEVEEMVNDVDGPVHGELSIMINEWIHVFLTEVDIFGQVSLRGISRMITVEDTTQVEKAHAIAIRDFEPDEIIPGALVFIVPGRKKNSCRFICGDWVYYRDKRVAGILRCSEEGCKATLRLEPTTAILTQAHYGHRREPHLMEEVAMVHRIQTLASTTTYKSLDIWNIVRDMYPNAVQESYVTLKRCTNLITSARYAQIPEIPDDLNYNHYYKSIYSHKIILEISWCQEIAWLWVFWANRCAKN